MFACPQQIRPRLALPGLVIACLAMLVLGGCGGGASKSGNTLSRYDQLSVKKVPEFMRNTIYEVVDLANPEPFAVSGYGLVVNLRDTGNSNVPTAIREYMIKEMVRHGIGRHEIPGYERLQPEDMLNDSRVTIVRVDGFIPPGARKGQRFDAQVSALNQSYTTSLSHGQLFQTDLGINGANEINPGGSVNIWAKVWGSIFVNPAYAMSGPATRPAQKASLRYGIIMDGGLVMQDQPLRLRLRTPQFSLARAIELRVDDRFQGIADMPKKSGRNSMGVAAAMDDGTVNLYVPGAFRGDWEHFVKVATHLYRNNAPDFSIAMTKKLVEEAVKPNAPLEDISYCWEGIGELALPFIQPLLNHTSPEVQFAAARAAAYIGDTTQSAQTTLMDIASTPNHPFQVNAVQVLGTLPMSPAIANMLRKLLLVEQSTVRIEAYRALAQNRDERIISRVVREKYILDILPFDGNPLIYASRQGLPRIAIMGDKIRLDMPFTFLTMENRFSISSDPTGQSLTLYYRDKKQPKPIVVESSPDLVELLERLGGGGPVEEPRLQSLRKPRLDFSYSDVLAILQQISDRQKLVAEHAGKRVSVPFMLQEPPELQESIYNAPVIPEVSRPQEGPAGGTGKKKE